MVPIILLAAGLRLYGIMWDGGFHLHPDERMLIMVADRIRLFSQMNPDFFNYGSLPVYLLKGAAQLIDSLFKTGFASYDGMLTVGRALSAATDLVTLFLVYRIALLLSKNRRIALYSSLVYALAVFPIQNSHFFVVDVYLTCFLTATLFFLLSYLISGRFRFIPLLAVALAAALATKFTAVIFIPFIATVLIFYRWKNFRDLAVFIPVFFISHFIFMPYAYLEYARFIADIKQQTAMSRDAYVFPYTLQYVRTLPYLYYLKNIFLWGMGPVFSFFSMAGIYVYIKGIKRHGRILQTVKENPLPAVFLLFYAFYFLVMGYSAVKFMRYMLPVYPFLAIAAGYGFFFLKKRNARLTLIIASAGIAWTVMFMGIYTIPHSRIQATAWILKNIPQESTLAVEHWDDRMPLVGAEKFNYVEMTLYDLPDDEVKWNILRQKLNQADYIVLASNRLFVPLPKLADCKRYAKCYPQTALYYKALFSGQLGFKKVYESHVYPSITLFGKTLGIDDQGADESFTVYDHPIVIIFKKS